MKYYIDAFKILNKNIILATPLVVFTLFLSIYVGMTPSSGASIAGTLFLLVMLWLMFGAFFAGWFYMVKEAISQKENDLSLLSKFPTGVGNHFVQFLLMLLVFAVLFVIAIIVTYKIGMAHIGSLGISIEAFKDSLTNAETLKNFMMSLTTEQLTKLNQWNLLSLCASSLLTFLLLLWAPEAIYSESKNPFLTLGKSLIKLVKKLHLSVLLFFYVTMLNMVISLLITFSMSNTVLYMIATIVA